MSYPIPGATRQDYESASVEASTRPFPYVTGKWTNHTAEVAALDVQIDQSGAGNDQIVIKARNGEYESRIYISLDPRQVGPNCADQQAQIQKNVDRLLKVGKALEIIGWKGNDPVIDPKLFKNAVGKIIEIGIQGAADASGYPKENKRGYQILNTSFSGIAQALKPVVAPHEETKPKTTAGYDDEVPF